MSLLPISGCLDSSCQIQCLSCQWVHFILLVSWETKTTVRHSLLPNKRHAAWAVVVLKLNWLLADFLKSYRFTTGWLLHCPLLWWRVACGGTQVVESCWGWAQMGRTLTALCSLVCHFRWRWVNPCFDCRWSLPWWSCCTGQERLEWAVWECGKGKEWPHWHVALKSQLCCKTLPPWPLKTFQSAEPWRD